MKPELRRVGNSHSAVVVIDDFTGSTDVIASAAEALAPFPTVEGNHYPGRRRVITERDQSANAYVEQLCELAAQFIAGAYDVDRFDLLEASFSMVTTAPADLSATQRAPHFDSTDQDYLALLYYLRVPAETGTAFFRHRATAIERVDDANVARFVSAAEAEATLLPARSGYIAGSDAFFEQIGAVEAIPDRMVIYQGSLLHSGIIPPAMSFSADPREGRLTANIFVRGRRKGQ